MNTHTLKIQARDYYAIVAGTKTIEARLWDEKRKAMKIGDTLIIQKEPDLQETVEVEIVQLHIFPNFKDMLKIFPISALGHLNAESFLHDLALYYPEEKQKEHSVVGIEMRLKK